MEVQSALAKRVSDLEARLTALEQALGGKAPPAVCRYCGKSAVRLDSADFDAKGNVLEYFKCEACEKIDLRSRRPR